MGPIQVVVQDGNNLVLEVTPTPSTTVILDRGIAGPPGPTGTGDVDGPASATDNAVARFDGTTGKLIQNSVVTIGDTGNMAGVGTLAVTDLTDSSLTAGRVTYAGTGGNLVDSANLTFNGTTLTANALTVTNATTLNAGTANGVAYLNGSKVLTTGSALTFDGTSAFSLKSNNASTFAYLDVGRTASDARIAVASATNDFLTGTAAGDALFYKNTAGNAFYGTAAAGAAIFTINNSEQMRLTSTGLGIGTSSPSKLLDVGGVFRVAVSANSADILGKSNSTGGLNLFGGDSFVKGAGILISADTNATDPNTIKFTRGAFAESMRLDASGNLGLGVAPRAWIGGVKALDIGPYGGLYSSSSGFGYSGNAAYLGSGWTYTATGAATYYDQNSGTHAWFNAPSGTAGNAISFTQAMTLDASGNLGVGTTSPADKLQVVGGVTFGGDSGSNRSRIFESFGLNIEAGAAGGGRPIIFGTNNTERARITSGGEIAGTSAGSYGIRQAVTAGAGTTFGIFVGAHSGTSGNTSSGTDSFIVWSNGNVVNTNNSYGALSDVKLKENVTDATPKLDKLNQVRIVNFNIIGSEQKQLGVIAQELEQVFPGMVDESPDRDAEGNDLGTTTKSVKYSVFVPMLIKAIQELKAEFDAYKASHP